MDLIKEISDKDELFVSCEELNMIIEDDQVFDWIQVKADFGSFFNIKISEDNYCDLIVKDAEKGVNLNIYLSKKSLAKENKL